MLGKDWLFARLVLWWLYTRPGSLAIVTGPTQTQIGTIVWKEIRKAVFNAPIPFSGRISSGAKTSPQQVDLGNGWQALGFSTTSIERASGQHAGELAVFVIEGSGIEEEIWDAIESLGYEKLIINGNPIRAEGRFVDLIHQAEKDAQDGLPNRIATNAIRISSLESPHASLEKSPVGLADKTWLDSVERRYGKNSLWYKSHVLAEIPLISADILIPIQWLDYAYTLKREARPPNHPIHNTRRIAVDLGEGVGRDSTCLIVRDNNGVLECVYGNALGLAEAAAKMQELGVKWKIPTDRMSYDVLGIGRTMANHLARYGLSGAKPYAGEGSPRNRSFTNLRTEAAWRLRTRLDLEHIPDQRNPHTTQDAFTFCPGPYQARLRDEIKPLTYELHGPQTKLLPKKDWLEILGFSPDIADALIQSFAY